MNLCELQMILRVMKIDDLKLNKNQWEEIKERILSLAEPFFKDKKEI